ncbi:hypothetical protein L4174_009190 [Photobacterium sp. CCB-ST2H9]|uniref:hypothetical protein n=1 Tax=unclassified Photobacterium TaxID=2628852 RepID=UPI002004A75B|nr:hypothetical protein [Photobacterium sp. CCB-ST2H9]UTM56028.1 hypothetical protein L4174_009190 [Photobacterium sp. CCB-ST2H9]
MMMNTIFFFRAILLTVLRYTVYLPFLAFYCFVVGPVVGGVLLVGGVAFVSLILGPSTAVTELRKAYGESESRPAAVHH